MLDSTKHDRTASEFGGTLISLLEVGRVDNAAHLPWRVIRRGSDLGTLQPGSFQNQLEDGLVPSSSSRVRLTAHYLFLHGRVSSSSSISSSIRQTINSSWLRLMPKRSAITQGGRCGLVARYCRMADSLNATCRGSEGRRRRPGVDPGGRLGRPLLKRLIATTSSYCLPAATVQQGRNFRALSRSRRATSILTGATMSTQSHW